MRNTILTTLSAALSIATLSIQAFASTPVVYGKDDRKDLYEVLNPLFAKLADSTVALIESDNLSQNASGIFNIQSKSLMALANVCSSEPYADQPSGAFCSGSLIGKNIILTAGHCVTDAQSCADVRFVFGYNVSQKGVYPTSAKQSEVYSCKKIIHREQDGHGADFAVIELDREVPNHEVLKVNSARMNSTIEVGTKLVMIGHPVGLPTKVDDGGSVRDASKKGFFLATTDSYGGNSGSAVFNYLNGEIEGVLVRGENDFVIKPGTSCRVTNMCSETGCRGEDVTKISAVIPYIPH